MTATTFATDKANGKLMGVCSGLARSSGVDVTLVRVLTVITTVCLTGLTIPLYIAAALLAPKQV
jgi:phage shock protein PspC (stress-responsive transcriptional regulator)